jgi:hypothetical protein
MSHQDDTILYTAYCIVYNYCTLHLLYTIHRLDFTSVNTTSVDTMPIRILNCMLTYMPPIVAHASSVLQSENMYKVSVTHLIRCVQMYRAHVLAAGDAEQQGGGRSCTVHGAE